MAKLNIIAMPLSGGGQVKTFRIVVLVGRWENVPPGVVTPPAIAVGVLEQMFSESPDLNWTLPDLFVQSTLNQVRFNTAIVHDIGALPGTRLANGATPGSLVPQQNRGQVINIALTAANSRGIVFGSNDRVIVFINPPPCDAGAFGDRALLDQGAEHTYLSHELGHIIGYPHSFASDLTGDQNTVYGDPYCIMSARTFGNTRPQGSGVPAGATPPAGLPPLMWQGRGPLASAALTAQTFPDFDDSSRVIDVPSSYRVSKFLTTLVSLSEATANDAVVARIQTGAQTFFIEYRSGTGWDSGLTAPDEPPPAIVIHRSKPSAGAVVSYAGNIRLPIDESKKAWLAADEDFLVELVRVEPGRPSRAQISISTLYQLSAVGNPTAYLGGTNRVLYWGANGHINEIGYYPERGNWGHFDLSAATGGPRSASKPMGYVAGTPRVVYRGQDNHIHEIGYYPESGSWGHFDMTAATGAPPAASAPFGYDSGRVVYRGFDNHIHEIGYYPESGSWGHFDLSAATGAPPSVSEPMGYVAGNQRVVYRGQDNHIHEIGYYPESGSWGHFDMTAATGAPPAASAPFGYDSGRVVYRGFDNHIHEIGYYPESGSWGHFDMTLGSV